VYVCRAVKAGKGPDYCANTSAVPREELHLAVVAALRKTFSAESFRAHQQRVASDVEAKSSRRQQREHLSIALPQLQAKAGRLAKAVADLDDAGALLAEYEAVQAQVKEAKATIEYLDKADRQDAAQAADVAQLEATWSDWVTKLDQDPGLARQALRKVLAAPIAVRPVGKGEWRFPRVQPVRRSPRRRAVEGRDHRRAPRREDRDRYAPVVGVRARHRRRPASGWQAHAPGARGRGRLLAAADLGRE